ncbi:MAG TPA: DUF423 domain-containing protein [Rhodocyclaceae bacterium]
MNTTSAHARWFLALGAIAASLAVALGAAASHALRDVLASGDPAGWFGVALEYHRWHALGLILVGLATVAYPASRWFAAAGWLLVLGLLLFSGNLYLRSLAGIHAFHAATPFGGGAFIVAWLAFAIGAFRLPRR